MRRIPELNPKTAGGQETLFQTHRHHAFFTTVDAKLLNTVAADKTHRKHAQIEQVNADLKDSAQAHLPSGVFAANPAWLATAVMALANSQAGLVRLPLPAAATRLNPVNPAAQHNQNHPWNTQSQRGPAPRHALCPHNSPTPDSAHQPSRTGESRLVAAASAVASTAVASAVPASAVPARAGSAVAVVSAGPGVRGAGGQYAEQQHTRGIRVSSRCRER